MYDGIYVFRYDTTLQKWINISDTLPFTCYYSNVRLYDVNCDGYTDLVANTGNTVEIWTGNSDISWTLVNSIVIPNQDYTLDMLVSDVNHDAKPEIFLWSRFPVGLFNYVNKLYMLRDTVAVTALSLIPKYPKGYECLAIGSVRFITWISAVPSNHPSSVSLELSVNGNTGPWSNIVHAAPNNGIYQWMVPDSASNNCYIRYIITDSINMQTYTALTPHHFNIGCVPGIPPESIENISVPVIVVKPNPAKEVVRIEIKGRTEKTCNWQLNNNFGQKVMKGSATGDFQIGLSALARGVYFINIQSDREILTRKIVKL